MISLEAITNDIYAVQINSVNYTVVYVNGEWSINDRPDAIDASKKIYCIELCQHYRHYVCAGIFEKQPPLT